MPPMTTMSPMPPMPLPPLRGLRTFLSGTFGYMDRTLYTTTTVNSTGVNGSLAGLAGRPSGDVLQYIQIRSRTWAIRFILWCLIFLVIWVGEQDAVAGVSGGGGWCRGCHRSTPLSPSTTDGTTDTVYTVNRLWLMASVFFLVVQAMTCVVVDWSSPWAPKWRRCRLG